MKRIFLASFLVTVLIMGLFSIAIRPVFIRTYSIISSTTQMVPIGTITKGVVIREEFPDKLPNANQISLFMATYGRINTSKLAITIRSRLNGKWSILSKYSLRANTFHDNSYHVFNFPMITKPDHRLLEISISSPDGTSNNAITAWTTSIAPSGRAAILFVNGRPQSRVIPVKLDSRENVDLLSALSILSHRILPLQNILIKWVFVFAFVIGCWLTLAVVALTFSKQGFSNE